MMLRDPSARGPNSIRFWNQPTTFCATIASTVARSRSSSDSKRD
jgi:hypothetical protein